jgi:transcriptional regulator GlxA family with amidase domain
MKDFSKGYYRHATQPHDLRDTRSVRRIGIALFTGFALPDVVEVVEIFQSANALGETAQTTGTRYDVCVLSVDGDSIASSSSVLVCTDSIYSRNHAHDFHALFIAGGAGVRSVLRDDRLIAWLRRMYLHTELIFPIAEARLLLEAARFGDASDEPQCGESAPVVAKESLTAGIFASSSSPLLIALKVVEDDLGAEIARQIASCVEPLFDTHFTAAPNRTASDVSHRIQAAARFLETNSNRPISINEAAQIASMSERNLLRRFKLEMGVTPSDYLLHVRLDMCCRLLAETSLPADKIARRCGLGDGGRLSKIFRKQLGTTPSDYRAGPLNSMRAG